MLVHMGRSGLACLEDAMTETPQELIARLMQHVEDTMVEAIVDYPAGREAGASISYDSDFLQKCFETELAASLAREVVLEQKLEDERDNARAAYERGYWERGNGE